MASRTRRLVADLSAAAGNAQRTAALLGDERRVNEADALGMTALHCAAHDGLAEVVRLLLARQDVELNQSNAEGGMALILASQDGHLDTVRLLLERQDVEVNQSNARAGRR